MPDTDDTVRSYDVFLSYSRNDPDAANLLRAQLEDAGRLSVFKDDRSIYEGELWLDKLQAEVDGCGTFVVLVGRDGVRRWVGAETQAALSRHFGPHDDAKRLPIFPILLGGTEPETLPAFLRLFQATHWNGADPLPDGLLDQIRNRKIIGGETVAFEGCPFVGLAAYSTDQAHLFFGRQKETLDALACFETRPGHTAVRWLEINGNSGSGKSSLMNAGLLPLIDQGWLWPRTGYERWQRIGPMMPGAMPVEMLAECLAQVFSGSMADIITDLAKGDDRLRYWLRDRKVDKTAFLLVIDQFEELFTFAEPEERRRFDRLLAAALMDTDCPLFLLTTVRSDFLDRFGEDLPRLVAARNRVGRPWTLSSISEDGLREVIEGPARLAGLIVSEVKEAMLTEARDEPGALPLVENALDWLWQRRQERALSGRLFTEQGGLAGILSRSADDLLDGLGPARDKALELLLRLVKVDPEGVRHSRRRLDRDEALAAAGGGEAGLAVVARLSGQRRPDGGKQAGPLRLITISDDGAVNLIHETLIRSKDVDKKGKQQPYWPTLWSYIEAHKQRAAWIVRLKVDTQNWIDNGKRASDLWSHERVREAVTALGQVGAEVVLSDDEQEFLGPINPDAMLKELDRPETTHKRRLLIGERLDVLGEPPSRWGVGVDERGTPRIDWRPVPGGVVTVSIRSDPDNGNSPVSDRKRKRVEPFHIARYPVTVVQYRAFIDAEDGWRDKEWWSDDRHGDPEGALYRDPDGNTYELGRFGNHPVVYVSWFDAVAFCRWLSRRLGYQVRLPDEWEWQQAATGGNEGNVFPWGPDWEAKAEPWRGNTFESRLGQATAVGMYPAGAAPTGALDMAGTVWEWVLNKFEKTEVTGSSARDFDPRVLRGGSWDGSLVFARASFRFWINPDDRNSSVGFRVVCSSPSSGH